MGKLIELIIDEEEDAFGVEAISLVKYPAIEHNWVFFSKDKHKKMLTLAEVNEEQKTIVGPALIPDKEIPRYEEETDEEYHVYFSKETVKQASELFLKHNRANMHTFEHATPVEGVTVVESWLVSNPEMDKSNLYSMDVPEGTWMVRLKIENEEVWETIKEGKVQGLSIEGYFVDKIEKMSRVEMESYSDYPDSVKNNAQAVLDYVDENGWGGCGTDVGKQRANQLAKGEAISLETVKRMKSYLERHAGDLDSSSGYGDGCGKLMYDAWGGKSALSWAESTINKAEKEKENMSEEEEVHLDDPCWEGYEMVGMKIKDGEEVPNCVPIKDKMSLFEIAKDLFERLKPRKLYAELPLSTGGVLVTEEEEVKLGSKVYTLDEDGNPIDVKDGAYTTQAEKSVTVLQGMVTEYDGEGEEEELEKEEEDKVDLVSEYKEMYKKKLAEIADKKKTMSADGMELLDIAMPYSDIPADEIDYLASRIYEMDVEDVVEVLTDYMSSDEAEDFIGHIERKGFL